MNSQQNEYNGFETQAQWYPGTVAGLIPATGVPIIPAIPMNSSVRPNQLVSASRPSKSTRTTDVRDT